MTARMRGWQLVRSSADDEDAAGVGGAAKIKTTDKNNKNGEQEEISLGEVMHTMDSSVQSPSHQMKTSTTQTDITGEDGEPEEEKKTMPTQNLLKSVSIIRGQDRAGPDLNDAGEPGQAAPTVDKFRSKSFGGFGKSFTALTRMASAAKVKKQTTVGDDVWGGLYVVLAKDRHTQKDAEFVEKLLSKNPAVASTVSKTGDLPLHVLCKTGSHTEHSVEICRTLLNTNRFAAKERCKVPARDKKLPGLPLHFLCAQKSLTEHSCEICRIILAGFEETTSEPCGGKLPIEMVVDDIISVHHTLIFKRLLDANEDASKDAIFKTKSVDQRRLLHRLCLSTPNNPHSEETVEVVRLIVSNFKRSVDLEDSKGCKPIHVLCMSSKPTVCSVQIYDWLVQKSPDSIFHKSENGMIPLHFLFSAANFTDSTTVLSHKLLDSFPKAAHQQDSDGRTVLHFLCSSAQLNKFSVVCARQILLANGNATSCADKNGRKPMHNLCAKMDGSRVGMEFAQEIFDMMILNDEEAVTAADEKGKNPLHLLSQTGFLSKQSITMLEKFLKTSKDILLIADLNGCLPLHLLCAAESHSQTTCDAFRIMIRGLREAKTVPESIRTIDGELPLHGICGAGLHSEYSVQMFRMLLQAYPDSVTAFDASGKTAIHRLCGARGHTTHTAEIFTELLETMDKAGKNGAELRTHQHGELPLHIIVGTGQHTQFTYQIFAKLLSLFPDGCLVASDEQKELPVHVLCAAPNPQQVSKKMCRDLLEANRDSVKVRNQRGLVPLEVVCTVKDLTESSVDICSQIADACSLEESTDVFLNALNVLCKSTQFTEHSVMTCKVILSHIKRKISTVTGEGILPLHALCKAEEQNDSTAVICTMLLEACPEWARVPNTAGSLPLHVLCECTHKPLSIQICRQLLAIYQDATLVPGPDDALPLHMLANNGLHSKSSVALCREILKGTGKDACRKKNKNGLLPLHLLCTSRTSNDCSVEIGRLLLKEYADASWLPVQTADGSVDKDLVLHKLCKTTPHSASTVKLCRLLLQAYDDGISVPGNHHDPAALSEMEADGIDPNKEPGDEPLVIACQVDHMTRYTADLCLLLSGNGTFSIHHALQILNQKVYCPKHDEIQQKFALRALISLAFVDDDALQYIELDPECTSSGPRNLTFVNAVEREMGIESDNPLLHVLRMAKLYRDKARTTSSVLAGRLSAQSALSLEWGISLLDMLPFKIAQKAVWTPERYSIGFMQGSSPIGIGLELGDLKIVSHPIVFEVVKLSWPGKYMFDYNPMIGTIYSNLFLEFEIGGGNSRHASRKIVWTWQLRFAELLSPSNFIESPMNMYFLFVVMQTLLLIMFQITVDFSGYYSNVWASFGGVEFYIISHTAGGLVYELGQILNSGLIDYLQDPWNYIDMSMYGLLAIWAISRGAEAIYMFEKHEIYVPNLYSSSQYLGIAGICIWLRMLNVFGLDPYFGPLVRIMQGMTTGVVTFLILLAIFVMGFSTALRTVFLSIDLTDPSLQNNELIDEFDNSVSSIILLLDMALGQFSLSEIYQISGLGLVIVFSFLACTFVMLFNLLIALMTDTYADIRLQSEQLWKRDRAILMGSFILTDEMLKHFNFATLCTGMPAPLNLVLGCLVTLMLPFYLAIQYNVRSVSWERKANDLRLLVTKSLIFILVCFPTAMTFLLISLPVNWILVVSGGTLEYLKLRWFQRDPGKRILVSRLLGFFCTPFFLICFFLTACYHCLRLCLSRGKPTNDAEEDDHEHSQKFDDVKEEAAAVNDGEPTRQATRSHHVTGQAFGTAGESGFEQATSDPTTNPHTESKSSAYKDLEDPHGHHHHEDSHDRVLVTFQKAQKEIWEEEFDEDEIIQMQEILAGVIPEDEKERARMAKKEGDPAMEELKAQLTNTTEKFQGLKKTMLDSLADLRQQCTLLQQQTAKTLIEIKDTVTQDIANLNEFSKQSHTDLLKIIDENADATEHRLREQDDQTLLLLAAVVGPIAKLRETEAPVATDTEGGLLLTAINRRIERLERLEQSEIMRLQEFITSAAARTERQLDTLAYSMIDKISNLSNALQVTDDKSSDNFKVLRTAVIDDMRPVLSDLDDRVKRTEELQLANKSKMEEHASVLAGISPALSGIETRLAANAVKMQRDTRAEIAEQLSQAIEIKMGELMGEIELGLSSPVRAPPAAKPPRDTRVDAPLDELTDKGQATKTWGLEPEHVYFSARPAHRSNEDGKLSRESMLDSNGLGTPNGRGKGKKAQTMSGAMDYRNESELSIEAQQQLVQQLLEGRGRTADPPPDWQVEWERLQALRSKQDASKSSSASKSPAAHR